MKQLGRYEILEELGRGAMGVVFKARDPLIGRLIALKTITTFVAEDPAMVERFWREAKAAGALQHANIVTIHDVGEADGVPFIAMEYLEGESLASLISRGAPLTLTDKIGYLVQACRALQYAHRRSVIHRDIKPANIVRTVDGVIKVVDFGIARVADSPHTHTGTLLGTLGYMSPQQIRGKRADALSDIWSVGVVMYELLTGRRPFKGGNQADLMLSILNDEPVPLNDALGGCPYQLVTISRRALAKNEANRYRSMEELLLDMKSAWASIHIDKPGERVPAAGVQTAAREFAMHEAESGAKPHFAPSHPAQPHFNPSQPAHARQKQEPRELPAIDARPSGLAVALKPADIPAIPTPEVAASPAPAIPRVTRRAEKLAWSMPEWASWQRGLAILTITLAVVTIVLEASHLRLHSPGSTPVSAASDPATPAPSPAETVAPQAVSAKTASSAIPKASRRITRWPEIGCGAELPASDAALDAQDGYVAACGALDPPKLQWVRFFWPEFPTQAQQAGLPNGVALLTVTVDPRGSVIAARSRVPADPFGFTDAAIQAASKWKTTMPRVGGMPVRTEFSVDVPFNQQ